MQKLLLFFLLLSLSSFLLKSQDECEVGLAQTQLAVNNVNATLLNSGDMFWDTADAKYEYPAGSGKNLLFNAALWMSGIDELGQLLVSAQTYRQSGTDFFPGPIIEDEETCFDFDRFWEVEGPSIFSFLVNFHDGVITEASQIDPTILTWPGKNNPYFNDLTGFDLPEDQHLAPFWDENNDGKYDPMDGDYPVINPDVEGVYADQMIWWVFNDSANEHTESGGLPLGMEVGVLAYAWQTDDYRNDATFYRYTFRHKGPYDLEDFYIGQWIDTDIGNVTDEYIACDTTHKLVISYNSDEFDEGENGYGEDIPMLGIKLLEDLEGNTGADLKFSSFIAYNNDFTTRGNPETAQQFRNYLLAKWKDDSSLTYGGNGYGGTTPTNYMYPSSLNDPMGWSACADTNAYPSDTRSLMSMGPFDFNVGDVGSITVAFLAVPPDDLTYPCPSLDPLFDICYQAESFFEVQNKPFFDNTTWITSIEKLKPTNILVYPNPAKNVVVFDMSNLKELNKNKIQIMDNMGRIVDIIDTDPAVDDQRIIVKDYSDGIYFYKILNNFNNVISHGKFAKY